MTTRKFHFYILFTLLSILTPLLFFELALHAIGYSETKKYEVRGADFIYEQQGLTGPQHYTFDKDTGYSLIKDMNDTEQNIQTDPQGFRTSGKPIDQNKSSIIFVGDSTVFGWGVKNTDTYVYRLAQLPQFNDYNLINMGVPSYSLAHILEVIKNKVPLYKPKIVVVQILWPWKPFEAYSNPEAWKKIDLNFYQQTIPSKSSFVNDRASTVSCITCSILQSVYKKIKYSKQIQQNLTRPGIRDFNVSSEVELQLAQDHIDLLKQTTDQLDKTIKFIYFIHPYQYTVFHEQYKNLGLKGKKLMTQTLPAYDPTPFITDHYKGTPLYIDGSHLNSDGHKVFCSYFNEILKSALLLKLEGAPDCA